ncbi:unnamed protein product [Symbiodinium natans]|uniref:Uncharacterized protein n=1 Tax=Symbiodinium natans TaxID=878477 RepID=A0A812JI36_9DINO|nr:unnamed protein product [Symbiodinium natans]
MVLLGLDAVRIAHRALATPRSASCLGTARCVSRSDCRRVCFRLPAAYAGSFKRTDVAFFPGGKNPEHRVSSMHSLKQADFVVQHRFFLQQGLAMFLQMLITARHRACGMALSSL